jgi:S-(hydroxymethyl)glutathione dehydrogenase/alcohol dehydrogenase
MRGVVFDGERLDIVDDLEVRDPGLDEVKVRVVNAGLCASDLSVVKGTIPYPTPVVLGHEGAGVVEEVGAAVTTVKPGDHVVLTTLGNCGLCPQCESGHPTLCRRTFGQLSQPFHRGDEALWSFANASVFAESVVVREGQAVPIPPEVPFEAACLIGCGVLTGFGAAVNRARVGLGDSVAVFGVGGIGLNVIQGAAVSGATRIVAIDTVAEKEALALQFGATDFVLAGGDGDTAKTVRRLVGGNGVDHAFECVGHPAVFRDAVAVLDWGGQVVILGVPKLGTEASFVVADLYNDKAILGCRYGSSRPRHDIPLIVDLYLSGRLKLDELVTKSVPMSSIGDLIDDLTSGRLARGVMTVK